MKNLKRTLLFLTIAFSLVLVSMIGASALQSNFGKVDIIDIRADLGGDGQFSMIMYKPKTATPSNPAPVVIASHGYLNNREMQDIVLVELARRGIVVISMDRTGHGHSEVNSAIAAGMVQAVEYAYTLDFIDNTKIGITGHSMGGMSTTQTLSHYSALERTAMLQAAVDAFNLGLIDTAIPTSTETVAIYNQLEALNDPVIDAAIQNALAQNKIHSSLTVAASPPTTSNSYGVKSIVGNVVGQFDEFFFKQAGKYTHRNANLTTPDLSPNTTNNALYEWLPKDFLSSPSAAQFIKTVYAAFPTVARNTVPLEGQPGYDADLLDLTRSNPVIQIPVDPIVEGAYYTASGVKEFNYQNPIDERAVVMYAPYEIHPWNHFSTATAGHTIEFFYSAFGLVTGYSYMAPTNQTWLLKETFNLLGLIGFFLAIVPIALLFLSLPFFARAKKDPTEDLPALSKPLHYIMFFGVGIGISLICGFLIRYTAGANFLGTSFFPIDQYFPQHTTGYVALWAASCGVVTLILFTLQYLLYGRKHGQTFGHWGLKLEFSNVLKMLFLAVVVVSTTYLLLSFADFFTKTDFRIWSFAIRTFENIKIDTAIRYMTVFVMFYFVNSIVINGGNRIKGMPEWLNIMICAIFNVFGIALVFGIQYGTFFATGAMWQWDMNMTYVVLFPIIPILVIAAILSRKLYRATGSIWLPVFLNTILFTMITVANTSTSLNYLLFR